MSVGPNRGRAGNQVPGEIYFLRQRETDGPQMQALMEGKLALTKGCLRIESGYGEQSHVAIWPFEFGFRESGGSVHILNGEGQVVAQIGDRIRGGGGEIPRLSEEELEENFIGTFQCSGRYWVVNSDVAVIVP